MDNEKNPVVLTIDDEKAIRKSFRNFLEDYDYTVLEAENGRIGLEIFEREKPDLVLVDLRMPEVDGLEVLAKVTQASPNTPIIVASGTGVMGEAVEALHLGAWDYLLKPIEDLSVLHHSVEKALERSRLIRENRAYQEHLEELVAKRTKQLAKSNEALRESEENLSITLDSIGDAVIATDKKGNVTRMNPVAEKLTGWPLEEAAGVHLSKVFHIINADTLQPAQSPLEQVMNSGQIVGLAADTILVARDKNQRRIADSGAPILSKDGSIVGVVLVFRDITDQYKLEEQLRQSQKMDAIGQLAGGVAHDFNNMLGGIIGAADLLSLKVDKNAKLRKYVTIIQDAGKRAAQLTRKLLDFSRKGKDMTMQVEMHKLTKETIRLLERSIDRRISITENFAASRTTVTGDPSQLQNALLNLAINARDAMPEGGILTISTTNVTLSQNYCNSVADSIKPGDYIEINVEDTGTGMSKEVQDRIFEPFFTTKGTGKGTGLGLASVYTMIRNHQGSINVYSHLDKGTVFKLYLPVIHSPGVKQSEEKEKVYSGTGRILVVDDEAIIRVMAEEMLSNFGYKVITANDGAAGLEMFKNQHKKIDLVLLDIMMPRMNGKDAFLAMQKIDPNVKVLLISGFSRGIEIANLIDKGACGFLQKPFPRTELGKKVGQILAAAEIGGN
ncbi:MAG: response regulator [bacterium]|nr:response regulator [bacterium]